MNTGYWVIKNGNDQWLVRESSREPIGVLESIGPYDTLAEARKIRTEAENSDKQRFCK